MSGLSTPDSSEPDASREGEGRGAPRRRLSDLFLFFVVPVSVALVFVAVLVAERTDVDSDLQIVSPAHARPGGGLAVRGFHFRDLDRAEGPILSPRPGRASLVDPSGRAVAHAPFLPSAAPGLEAVLEVPEGTRGELLLRASVPLDHEEVSSVVSPVVVSPEPVVPEARGRLALPLQRYTLFPVRPEGDAVPPAHLVPRVLGGTCVPEVRCDLLVLVGAPAAEVSVESTAAVTSSGAPPPHATAGLVPLSVVTHGPEAELELVARRDGAIVARRTVRLPIALASFALRLPDASAPLFVAPAAPALVLDGVETERGIVVDAFDDGVWARTGSLPARSEAGADADPVALPFAPLRPGLWRIQARTDAFSSDSAAVRMLHVRAPGDPDEAVVRALAERARAEWNDTLARTVGELDEDPSRRAAFLLAMPEMDLVPQPIAMSGAMQAATGLDDRRVALRWIAAMAMLLAGVFVMVLVLRRGFAAGAEARAILVSAGDETADSAANRRRMALSLIAAVLAIALAFVAAAALVLARTGL